MNRKKTILFWIIFVMLFSTLACRAIFPEDVFDEPDTPSSETEPIPQDAGESQDFDEPQIGNDETIERETSRDDEAEFFEAPVLSGPEQIIDSEHFRIHYTLEGDDAIADVDYAHAVLEAMEHSWKIQISQLGWAPPPSDDGFGGDQRYDLYLLDIFEADGTAGYTDGGFPETFVGDNPLTPFVETRSHFSYLAIDNDYSDLDSEYNDTDLSVTDFMHSTVAHEFNHAVQFAYDGEEPAEWLWEATATWMQGQVYPDLRDADEELVAVFKSPDTCQLAYGGEVRVEDENHWYGLWIFIQYISENYGTEVVRSIWENAVELDNYDVLEVTLFDAGTSLHRTFRDFSVALLTRDFERGDQYPTVRLEGQALTGEVFTPPDGVGQMAADYVEIQAPGPVLVSLDADFLSGILVGIQGQQAFVFELKDNQTSLDAGQFERLYMIVLNENTAESESDCEFSSYTLRVEATSQTMDQPVLQTSTPNFTPPEVEELLDPETYWGEAPDELNPDYIPEGYEYSGDYQVEKDEFGEDADLFIPGEGPATVVDFWGPGEDDYFDITVSDSPYDTLDDWLDDIGYEPEGQIETIAGVDVLVEDWSEPDDPYRAATFILNGQFIVLTGTLPAAELILIVESLLY